MVHSWHFAQLLAITAEWKGCGENEKEAKRLVWAMKLLAILVIVFTTLMLPGCSNVPGSNGQYATNDRGNGTIDKSAPQYFSRTRYRRATFSSSAIPERPLACAFDCATAVVEALTP